MLVKGPPGYLALLLAAGATALARGLEDRLSAAPRTQTEILVYSSDSSEPAVAARDKLLWIAGGTATRVECHFGPSDPAAPVEAVAGDRTWPFLLDEKERRASLLLTEGIRAAWDAHGSLEIKCDGRWKTAIRLRPQGLGIGPDGEKFSVKERARSCVPGSCEWAEVHLDKVAGGWARLSVRTVEGGTLSPLRRVSQGNEVVFWIAEEECAVQVEGLSDRLIGRGEAELRVVRRWSPGKEVQAEIERRAASGMEPPLWFKAIEGIERELAAAEEHLDDARTMIDGGRLLEARSALDAGLRSQERTREKLRWLRWQPRLWIGPEGAAFCVEQRTSAVIPGSRGWLEVTLNDIYGGTVQLGVRTAAGQTLTPPHAVAASQEVRFGLGEAEYAIRVELLKNRLIGRDRAELRVLRRAAAATPEGQEGAGAEVRSGEAPRRREDRAGNERAPRAPGSGRSLGTEATELIERELAAAAEHVGHAEMLLADCKEVEARKELEIARRSQEESRQGLRWFRKLTGEELMQEHLAIIEDLSLVKVRVVRSRPEFELDLSGLDPASRSTMRSIQGLNDLVVKHLFGVEPFAQNIEVEIIETRAVGSRHAFGTDMGRRFLGEKRPDVYPGQTMGVHLWVDKNTFPGIKALEEGKVYWLAITPPLALKAIPRWSGRSGRMWVAFVMESRES